MDRVLFLDQPGMRENLKSMIISHADYRDAGIRGVQRERGRR
jgi:hypothetical protein